MDNLILEATNNTPEVRFEGDKGLFYIAGKSYPENVLDFYKPLFTYIENYLKNPKDKTELAFRWEYYNSATSQIIVKLIMPFKRKCKNFKVKWFTEEDFELMNEKGLELKEVLDIDLEIIV